MKVLNGKTVLAKRNNDYILTNTERRKNVLNNSNYTLQSCHQVESPLTISTKTSNLSFPEIMFTSGQLYLIVCVPVNLSTL